MTDTPKVVRARRRRSSSSSPCTGPSGPSRRSGRRAAFGIAGAVVLVGLLVPILLGPAGGSRPAGAAPVTVSLTAVADTFVDASKANTSYGTNAALGVDGSPVKQVFLRFDVRGVSGTVTAAKLRLHTRDKADAASPAGGTVARVASTTWSEATTTWNTRPAITGPVAGSFGASVRNTWQELDVTSLVSAGQLVSLAVTSTNADGADYDARTSPFGPQLVVSVEPTTTTTVPSTTTIPPTSTTLPPTTTTAATTTVAPTTTLAPSTATLTPVADTYVEDTTPTANHGTAAAFVVDASPVRQAFLRFDLAGLSGTVQKATLRLHVTASVPSGTPGSPSGGTVAGVSSTSWTETGTTWNTKPAIDGAAFGTLGAVAANTWYQVDVTGAVQAGGAVSFGVSSADADGAYYDSRESGANAPQLVVTTGSGPAPTTTTTAPATTTTTLVTTTTLAPGAVKVAAVGDAACTPSSSVTASSCRQLTVSDLIVGDPSISAFLALGDLQYDNGELVSFQTAYEASYGRVKAKTKPVPGNHEYNTANAAGYYAYFGAAAGDPTKGYYSFDLGTSWHVVALNSNCGIVSCATGSAQEQWLRADLAASTRPCTIALWHHPRFSSGASHGDNTAVAPLVSALYDDGVELLLTGHEHDYERFDPQSPTAVADPNGVREFVVGTGGRSFYGFSTPKPNSAVRISGAFGVLKLTLDASTYSWQFVAENGTVLDSGSAACR